LYNVSVYLFGCKIQRIYLGLSFVFPSSPTLLPKGEGSSYVTGFSHLYNVSVYLYTRESIPRLLSLAIFSIAEELIPLHLLQNNYA